ncbi:hypothetical protein [Nocardia fluminea]|uniref:hypothetical protein n=1 Tax=Nocardia fluminea TaxID=134984 RepID=UPI003D10406C
MTDEHIARELAALHADVAAALETAKPSDMNGPVVLANGMWANRWHMIWRVTEDREGARDKPARFVAAHLDQCRRWAGAQLRNSTH